MHYKQLTENERDQIYALNKAGLTQKAMAKLLGLSPYALSQELKRSRSLRGYRPARA